MTALATTTGGTGGGACGGTPPGDRIGPVNDATIRPWEPDDADACYEICLRTGDAGQDATALFDDPRLLGEVWVGPYLARWPELAFVVEDEEGVAGYIVGTPDTVTHDAWLEREWYPPLRLRHPLDAYDPATAAGRCVARIHRPPATPASIVERYPAHLHIDLLPRVQGRGLGRALMERFLAACRAAGATAVHLGCAPDNTAAIAFYRRLGFVDLRDGTIWGRPTDSSPVG